MQSETQIRTWAAVIGLVILVTIVLGFTWLVQNDFYILGPEKPVEQDDNDKHVAKPDNNIKQGNTTRPTNNRQNRHNPNKPKGHWSNNPKYIKSPPDLRKPEDRQDAVIQLKESTVEAIQTRSPDITNFMAVWMDKSIDLTPELQNFAQNDPNKDMRAFATRILQTQKKKSNRKVFMMLLDDEHWAVRQIALEGLDSIDDPNIIALAQIQLQDPNELVQKKAQDILDQREGDGND